MNNQEILERITGLCHPTRANKLTGANYPYQSAEPDTLTHTPYGAAGTGEFFPQGTPLPFEEYMVDWPAGVMNIDVKVEA
jgi:hypothetical protein